MFAIYLTSQRAFAFQHHFKSLTRALGTRSSAQASISEEERYLFDIEGFLVVKNVFSKDEVAAANRAVDAHGHELKERRGALRNTKTGTTLSGDGKTGRRDLAGMLGWPSPESDFFRSVLAHPKLVPYYHAFLGEGYRMDHLPLVLTQRGGAEGFHLHGGPIDDLGNPDFYLTYDVKREVQRTSLLAVAVQLTPVEAGSGGFCVVRGSHKANFKVPESLVHGDPNFLSHLHQPELEPGDVVMWTEATAHGSLARATEAPERRTALFRFAPSNIAYARTYSPSWPAEILAGLSEAQRSVLEPPYNNRLDRPFLKLDGLVDHEADGHADPEGPLAVERQSRSAAKKKFDKDVFKTDYF
eukprot:CAMPEP_0172616710 /NCGR_PEP_ID=MMETSP1068-20121228/66893_1 /TAXON_ID=35684 /ORGANISM="Pseudopedinella elastica, Strain CCMP716" /LENGTH=355 /DNA_ID=CAMNT_0013422233 /DNA_START=121 /DNA_END=1188 /DNA_ORIENTATION=-